MHGTSTTHDSVCERARAALRALAPPHRMHAARSARRLQRNIHPAGTGSVHACVVSMFHCFFFTSVPSTEKSAGGGFDQRTNIPSPCSTVQEYYFTVRCNKQTQVSVRPSTASSSCMHVATCSQQQVGAAAPVRVPVTRGGFIRKRARRDATPKLITRERHRPSDEPDKHHVHIITRDHSGSNIEELAS